MAYASHVRTKLSGLYIYQALTLDEAAKACGVSLRTALHWKKASAEQGDDWERRRLAARMAGESQERVSQAILEDYLLLHQFTIEKLKQDTDPKVTALQRAEALSRLADAFTKTMNAVRKSSPSLNNLAVANEVLQRQAAFIKARFPQHAEVFLEILEPFGEELAKSYG